MSPQKPFPEPLTPGAYQQVDADAGKEGPTDNRERVRVASPFKLTLMRTVPGNKKLEANLHSQFRHLKSHGEWFRGERELRRHIWGIAS